MQYGQAVVHVTLKRVRKRSARVRKGELPVLGSVKEAGTSKTEPDMKMNVAWLRP